MSIKSKLHPQTNRLCQTESETKPAPPPRNHQGKHLDVGEWLKLLDLERYEDLFEEFEGVEELLDHTEADVKALGVKISSHRAKIMSSLTGLRSKYHGMRRVLCGVR